MNIMAVKKGQSLVEAALAFVVLIFMVSALFDLGRAVLDYSILNMAVREGTRYAVVQPAATYNAALVKQKVQSYLFNIKDLDPNKIIISKDTVTVTIYIDDYPFNPITPFVKLILGQGLKIKVQSQMYLTSYAK